MKLNFRYDLDKDIENFIKSSKSKNDKKPTSIMEEYIEEYGESFDETNLKTFILNKTEDIDIDGKLRDIEDDWSKIEDEFISISQKIFDTSLNLEDVTVYLSLNSRCTYNIDEKYFFVCTSGTNSSNHIIMHELLHFYTWKAFGKKMLDNDIKESLTVLLNIEFKNLMGGEIDKGYPQHQEMRKKISTLWREELTVKEVVEQLR